MQRWGEGMKRYYDLYGPKVLFWVGVSALAGLGLSAAEFLLIWTFKHILVVLGFVAETTKDRLDEWLNWSPSPIEITFVFIGVGLLRALFVFLPKLGIQMSAITFMARLRQASIYQMLLAKNRSFVSAAELGTRNAEMIPSAMINLKAKTQMISSVLVLIGLFAGMLYYSPSASLFSIFGMSFVGLIVWGTNKKLRRLSRQGVEEEKKFNEGIQRVARNRLLVHVLKSGRREFLHLSSNSLNRIQILLKTRFLSTFCGLIPDIFGLLILASLLILNTTFFGLPGVDFVAFLYILQRFINNLMPLSNQAAESSSSDYSFKEMTKVYFAIDEKERLEALAPLIRGYSKESPKPLERLPDRKPPEIEIENLSFRYHPKMPNALTNLNLKFNRGAQVGIVGHNGSGKSTLLLLLCGVLEPSEGHIRIDGKSPKDYFSDPRLSVGYVGAEPYLIEGTLKENLEYGSSRQHSDDEFQKALESAHLWEFVRSLDSGLDYRLNESGEGLSAGQKQKLALARALLDEPQILILDEAFANLDKRSSLSILETLKKYKGQSTVLLVSHQDQSLVHIDQRIVLKAGRLVEDSGAEVPIFCEDSISAGPIEIVQN